MPQEPRYWLAGAGRALTESPVALADAGNRSFWIKPSTSSHKCYIVLHQIIYLIFHGCPAWRSNKAFNMTRLLVIAKPAGVSLLR
jgi:hypothetical protein